MNEIENKETLNKAIDHYVSLLNMVDTEYHYLGYLEQMISEGKAKRNQYGDYEGDRGGWYSSPSSTENRIEDLNRQAKDFKNLILDGKFEDIQQILQAHEAQNNELPF